MEPPHCPWEGKLVGELKRELLKRGLEQIGTKRDLVERLRDDDAKNGNAPCSQAATPDLSAQASPVQTPVQSEEAAVSDDDADVQETLQRMLVGQPGSDAEAAAEPSTAAPALSPQEPDAAADDVQPDVTSEAALSKGAAEWEKSWQRFQEQQVTSASPSGNLEDAASDAGSDGDAHSDEKATTVGSEADDLLDPHSNALHALAVGTSDRNEGALSSTAASTSANKRAPPELTRRAQELRDDLRDVCSAGGDTYEDILKYFRPHVSQVDVASLLAGARKPLSFNFNSVKQAVSLPNARSPPEGESNNIVVDIDEGAGSDAADEGDDAFDESYEINPYSCPFAPVALLCAYTSENRWVGVSEGYVVFEDDGIKYRTSTPIPLRENEDGASQVTLGSLWLLAALRERYEKLATARVCDRYCARQISTLKRSALLKFLSGRGGQNVKRRSCPNGWVYVRKCKPVSPEQITWTPVVGIKKTQPVRPCELQGMYLGAASQEQILSLQRRLAEAEEDENATRGLAESQRAVARAEADLARLRVDEIGLLARAEDLRKRLDATDLEVAEAARVWKRLHEQYQNELTACGTKLEDAGVSVKRRRVLQAGTAMRWTDPLTSLLSPAITYASVAAAVGVNKNGSHT